MRHRAPILLLALTLAAPACRTHTTDPAVLMEADRAFAAAVAEGGADAWTAWFAPDGAMLEDGVGEIRGRTAIRAAVEYLDRPGLTMSWGPDRADIAAGGDLGWTTGEWTLRPEPDAPPAGRGRYVSIWRLQPDGSSCTCTSTSYLSTRGRDPTPAPSRRRENAEVRSGGTGTYDNQKPRAWRLPPGS